MGRVVRLEAPRSVVVSTYEDPVPGPGQVRIQTLYSGVSAGTELTQYRGQNPFLERQWDADRRLFIEGTPSAAYPVEAWGYQEVGRVDALGDGVEDLEPGAVVYGPWQHRSSLVVDAAWAARRVLPDGVATEHGVFARIGAIALNAVLDADVHVGEYVAVFGLGVPGLLAVQLARANGGRVIAVDRMQNRLTLADDFGAHAVIDITAEDAAEVVRSITGGRGADVSIELTGSYLGLHDAVRATAYNSRVVCSGFLQGEGVGLRLGEEFHHNRITIVCSQISGVRVDLAHRWSRDRLETTVMDMIAGKQLTVERLISHVIPADRAAEAFRLLDERNTDVLQVVLDFAERGSA